MMEKMEARADTPMDDANAPGPHADTQADGGVISDDEEDDPMEDNMYDVPIYMSEVGDRDEHRIATSRREDRQSPRIWIEA